MTNHVSAHQLCCAVPIVNRLQHRWPLRYRPLRSSCFPLQLTDLHIYMRFSACSEPFTSNSQIIEERRRDPLQWLDEMNNSISAFECAKGCACVGFRMSSQADSKNTCAIKCTTTSVADRQTVEAIARLIENGRAVLQRDGLTQ